MVVFGFPDGATLIWLGGSHVRATGEDPVRRLRLQADALTIIARSATAVEEVVRAALHNELADATVVMDSTDLRRLGTR